MDTSKHSAPKLPSIQNMLADISVSNVEQRVEELLIPNNKDILFDAYRGYLNIKKLKEDLTTQDILHTKLEDLNSELVQSIENMKMQQ